MLVPSHRHTKEDLELWRELERADKAHSHSKMLARNLRRCQEILDSFVRHEPATVSVSWGKDSVLVAHLAYKHRLPMVWIKVEPIYQPDCIAVRDAFLKSHPGIDYHEIEVWCQRDEDGWHATGTLEQGIKEIHSRFGERQILGIRADESGTRRLRVWTYGPNTENKSAPLAYLTANDVFALLNLFDLPVHPAYAMLGGGRWQRPYLRVASLGGRRGDGIGRAEWEMAYYGDVLRRILAGQIPPA